MGSEELVGHQCTSLVAGEILHTAAGNLTAVVNQLLSVEFLLKGSLVLGSKRLSWLAGYSINI